MNPSQRLVFNAAATYGRSVFALALTLFSSRWILDALGAIDFGLFSLVGSVILFITLINSVMSGSVSRFLAFSIGAGKPEEVTLWLNAALSLHIILAFVLVLTGWPLGEYLIAHILNIPLHRLPASLWVFRVSLISAFVGMISVPFVAIFNAKQRISEVAGWHSIQTLLTFLLALSLTRAPADRLIFYAIGMVSIISLVNIAVVMRAFSVFSECRLDRSSWFEWARFKKIFSFAVWNMIGTAGATLRDQGSAMLLNLYFGAAINASFGIAKQVSTQTNQLSASMLGAIAPEITSREGGGDRKRMLSLSHRASKFGTILIMIFAVPLIIEMDYVLKLWLTNPPPYCATFCQLILGSFLVDRLSTGYMMSVNAFGRIAAYQSTVGVILFMTLPLVWLFLRLGFAPTSAGVVFIGISTLCTIGRILWMQRIFKEPPSHWFRIVFVPCLSLASLAFLGSSAPVLLMPPSLLRLALTIAIGFSISVVGAWFIACDLTERLFIQNNVRRTFSEIKALLFRLYQSKKPPISEHIG